jgi:hypothetical protein
VFCVRNRVACCWAYVYGYEQRNERRDTRDRTGKKNSQLNVKRTGEPA